MSRPPPRPSGRETPNLELVRLDGVDSHTPHHQAHVRPDLRIALEPFAAIVHELPPLMLDHWTESETDKGALPLDPDWDRMFMLARQGMLHCVTARSLGGLVGYVLTLTVPHVYSRQALQAEIQAVYLIPSFRGLWLGMRMLRESERILRSQFVIARFYAAVPDRLAPLFKRLGYRHNETVYTKVL